MPTIPINEILKKLKKNSMFRLSMTSKELFHSNFWAWLIDNYKQKFTGIFYPDYDNSSEFKVEREKNNFDLSLKFKDKIVIIENKFKSLPDKNQLQRYLNKAQNWREKNIILVSYLEPSFKTDTYISYKALYDGLKNADISDINPTDCAIIQNYTECIKLLCELKDSELTNSETIKEFWAEYMALKKDFDEINFAIIIQKIFLNNIAEKLINKIQINNLNYQINIGNSHVAYIDFFIPDTEFSISLYCNGEYKYVFNIQKENGDTKEKLIEKCKNKYEKFLSTKECIKKLKEYCCYMGPNNAWIYKTRKSKNNLDEIACDIETDLLELLKING